MGNCKSGSVVFRRLYETLLGTLSLFHRLCQHSVRTAANMTNIFCVFATDHISEVNKSLFFICRFQRQPAKYDQL